MFHRQVVARGIDFKQQLALVHMLVVLHVEFDNASGDIGGQRHYIGAHPGVPGPWRAGVMFPGKPAEHKRQQHHRYRRESGKNRLQGIRLP
ncbi:hypothetical protein D3C87_1894740 [compost metagenome]